MEPLYICFEHTTYWFEFSDMFGPFFYRIEKGEEIDVMGEFEFDENNDYKCTSNKFLWDFFDEWFEKYKIIKEE